MSSWPTGNGSHFTLRQQPVQDSKSLDEINGCFDFNEINANSSDNKWKLFLRKLRVEINRQLSQLTGHWPHFYIDPKELATLHEWDVRPHQGATTMQHISPESRLKSFINWPETGAIVPELLADAGFFYVGTEDTVRCFYCDGELGQWEPNDDPWVKHSRAFPDCGFILLHKGYAFVESCQQKFGDAKIGVKQLLDLKNYNDGIIKRAFHRRWLEKQVTFEHFGELYEKVVKCETEERARVICNEKHFMQRDSIDFGGNAFVESCGQKFGNSITNKVDEDSLALKATMEWFQSDVVKQLLNIRNYPINTVKAALHRRWIEKQVPFEHMLELNDAIVKYSKEKGAHLISDEKLNANSLGSNRRRGSNCALSSSGNVVYMEAVESSHSISSQSNLKRDDRLICKVCLVREVCVLFLPCAHLVTCTQCAPGISNCPVCNQIIKGLVRVFF